MKMVLMASIAILAGGCASPDFSHRPESIRISEPPIGSEHTSHMGDVMLRQGRYTNFEAIYVPENLRVSWAYTLLPGYYVKRGEDKKTETFLPGGMDPGAIQKAASADPWKAVVADKSSDKICVVTAFNAHSCTESSKFERRNAPVLSSDSFQQTLIYSGKVGNKINVDYREFSNDHARPAFNNDVEYDLASSGTIGYKGARLEIFEATNEFIRYRVIQNFNEAQY